MPSDGFTCRHVKPTARSDLVVAGRHHLGQVHLQGDVGVGQAAGDRAGNFAEQAKPGRTLFGAAAYERLQEIKHRYDADDLIRANHSVEPRKRRWLRR